jgi:hypothetical protein
VTNSFIPYPHFFFCSGALNVISARKRRGSGSAATQPAAQVLHPAVKYVGTDVSLILPITSPVIHTAARSLRVPRFAAPGNTRDPKVQGPLGPTRELH